MNQLLLLTVLLSLPGMPQATDPQKPIKVFILAGQSNMEGKAKVSLLEYQAKQPATRDLFKHLRKGDKWIERDDVWIKYLGQKGKLTVGYGSTKCIGPELEFGMVVGDHYPEQVLIIKTAWGGRSLYRDFRSPSAGLPAPAVLAKMLADQKKRKPDTTLEDVKKPFGALYRAMLEEVNGTLANLKTLFPDYNGQGYEIAGFVWFQGWNDMINADATANYAAEPDPLHPRRAEGPQGTQTAVRHRSDGCGRCAGERQRKEIQGRPGGRAGGRRVSRAMWPW